MAALGSLLVGFWLKMAPRHLKRLPETGQEPPKTAQDGPKPPKMSPKRHPRGTPEASRGVRNRSKNRSENRPNIESGPKTAQVAPDLRFSMFFKGRKGVGTSRNLIGTQIRSPSNTIYPPKDLISTPLSIYLSINLPPRRPNHIDRCRGAMWTGSLFCQCKFSFINSIDDRS